jgi:hypothetical protein
VIDNLQPVLPPGAQVAVQNVGNSLHAGGKMRAEKRREA